MSSETATLPAATNSEQAPLRLVVVTGMSGAGRSTAANTLEDLGWYVVDNLPPTVLPEVCRQARHSGITRLAVVLDVRTRSFFEQLPSMFSDLTKSGTMPEILFLEASDDVIVRRQESVRRPHPLQGDGRLLDGITAERSTLATLRAAADLVIDTSAINIHQLASRVSHAYGGPTNDQLRVTLVTFGFKNGIPVDADLVVDVRFLPNPHWVPELRPQTGLSKPVRDYVLAQDGAEEFLQRLQELLLVMAAGLRARGQAVRHDRARLHRGQAPQHRDGRGVRAAAAGAGDADEGAAPGRGPGMSRMISPRPPGGPARARLPGVVAFGGGHGLAASLTALRRITDRLTAIVTVADDGGSSGRLRAELNCLPPGDLRMALAALCGDDESGRTWADVLQYRFPGEGPLADHAIGNLLIVGPVGAAGRSGGRTGHGGPAAWELRAACCRWPPCRCEIEAEVIGLDPLNPDEVSTIRGQAEVAKTTAEVRAVNLIPNDPPACPESIETVLDADWIVLGPGSWFTSVIPHLLVPKLAHAIHATSARRLLTLNLEPAYETEGFSAARHVELLAEHAPDIRLDAVLADQRFAADDAHLADWAAALGADLVVADLAARDGSPRHDPLRLASAYAEIMGI